MLRTPFDKFMAVVICTLTPMALARQVQEHQRLSNAVLEQHIYNTKVVF